MDKNYPFRNNLNQSHGQFIQNLLQLRPHAFILVSVVSLDIIFWTQEEDKNQFNFIIVELEKSLNIKG